MKSAGFDDSWDAFWRQHFTKLEKYAGLYTNKELLLHRILSIRKPTKHHFVQLQNFSDKQYWQASLN